MNKPTTQVIGEWAAALDLDDLPESVVEDALKGLINGIGETLGGLQLANPQRAISLAARDGGIGRTLIIGTDRRVTPTYGLLANGVMANALGHEETHISAGQHPITTSLPVCLDLAEAHGRSGKEFLEALIVGAQVTMAVALMDLTPAVKYESCNAPAVYGTIGAAAASARLLGLDSEGIARAVAIATNFAGGLSQCVRVGSSEYHFNVGNASVHGYEAASLAAEGAEGAPWSFEGGGGFYHLFAEVSYDRLDAHDVGADVGAKLAQWSNLHDLIYKPYPVHFFNQVFIDAALELKQEHGIEASDITGLKLTINPLAAASGGLNRGPFENRGGVSGSTAFGVAAMLAHGKVTLAETEDVHDAQTRRIAESAEIESSDNLKAAAVTVTTSKGTFTIDKTDDDQDYRLPIDRIIAIFHQITSGARTRPQADAIVTAARGVASQPDISTLISLIGA